MTDTGTVQDVTKVDLGSQLAADAAHGTHTLYVNDAADFVEGWLVRAGLDDQPPDLEAETTHEITTVTGYIRVGGESEQAEILQYVAITEPDDDDDEDEDTTIGFAESSDGIGAGFGSADFWYRDNADLNPRAGDEGDSPPATITLHPSTPIAHPGGWVANTRVDVWDIGRGEVAAEWRALVRPDGDVDNTEAVDALVAYPVVPFLHEGVRTADQAESVVLDDETGEWTVTNVTGAPPRLDGAYIVGGTIRNPHPNLTGLFGGYFEVVNLTRQHIAPSTTTATRLEPLTANLRHSDYETGGFNLANGYWTPPAIGEYTFDISVRFEDWGATHADIALFLNPAGGTRDDAYAGVSQQSWDGIVTLHARHYFAAVDGAAVMVDVRHNHPNPRYIDHANNGSRIAVRRIA